MIHIVDQYVSRHQTYDHGGKGDIVYSTKHTLFDPDMWTIISAFVKKYHTPTGYNAIYHVFVKQGTNVCDHTANSFYKGCYQPDLNGLDFCAYHASVDIGSIGHVLYSVEPYQVVTTRSGKTCKQTPPWPNGILAESTFTTLSHEIFETITDPDDVTTGFGEAWVNKAGDEIGDICRSQKRVVTLYNRQFNLQGEYSNRIHNCAW